MVLLASQFLLSSALERSHRAQAAATERRRATQESIEQFERSFGYICEPTAHDFRTGLCTMRWLYQVMSCGTLCTASVAESRPACRAISLHLSCAKNCRFVCFLDVVASRNQSLLSTKAIKAGVEIMVSVTNDMTDLQARARPRAFVGVAKYVLRVASVSPA